MTTTPPICSPNKNKSHPQKTSESHNKEEKKMFAEHRFTANRVRRSLRRRARKTPKDEKASERRRFNQLGPTPRMARCVAANKAAIGATLIIAYGKRCVAARSHRKKAPTIYSCVAAK